MTRLRLSGGAKLKAISDAEMRSDHDALMQRLDEHDKRFDFVMRELGDYHRTAHSTNTKSL